MKSVNAYRLWFFSTGCLICLMLAASFAAAQSEKAPAVKRDDPAKPAAGASSVAATGVSGSPSVLVAPEEDYRIGSNDVLEVVIEDAPELSGSFRVTAAGTFLMPYLGRVTAKGRTIEDLAKFIADGLRERYLYDPRVTVLIKQYNSRSFFIHGSVRSPGVYQIEGTPSLLELLTVAGGLAPEHSSTAFVIRRLKASEAEAKGKQASEEGAEPEAAQAVGAPAANAEAQSEAGTSEARPMPQYTLLKVNIAGLLKGRFEQNMFLEPGDIVNIPPSEVFFVAGEVKQPGSFPLKEGTTLRQAISLAQGTTFKAATNRGVIFREDPGTGKRQEVAVDIGKVMKGDNEDVIVQANDIIIIPNSRMKSVAAPVLSAFGVSAARLPIIY